jgi:hypothetical protein
VEGIAFFNSNVGLGTVTPRGMLDIFTSTNTQCLQISQCNFSGNAIEVTTNNNPSTTFCVAGGGNVGVGTFIPQQRFHVNGSQYISNFLGIGVTNPSTRLHVDGTTRGVPGISSALASMSIGETNSINLRNIMDDAANRALVFSLNRDAYRVHEIRFMYYSLTSIASHTLTMNLTNASSYNNNYAVLTNGTWGQSLIATGAPSFALGTLDPNQCVSGTITIYSHDCLPPTTAFNVIIVADIVSAGTSVTRITGASRASVTYNNFTEFRLVVGPSGMTDIKGYKFMTGYGCDPKV